MLSQELENHLWTKPRAKQVQGSSSWHRLRCSCSSNFYLRLKGRHLQLAQLQAGGWHLLGACEEKRWEDRAVPQGNAARVLSEMAPQHSLLPLVGQLLLPQKSQNSVSLWCLYGKHLIPEAISGALDTSSLCRCWHCPVPLPPWIWLLVLPHPMGWPCEMPNVSSATPGGEKGSPQKLLEGTSWRSCSCDPRSWGECPMGAELGGEGWGAMLVLGEARKANFICDNIGIWGEISRCVAAFLQSLMDLFRRSTAVGDNYTLVGRRYSKIKRRGKAKREKKHTLFNSFLSMWLVYLSALQTCKYDYRALLCGFKMLENTWFSFLCVHK